jgi:hypothetical protein
MEIDSEEKEAMKDVGLGPSVPIDHPSDYQERSIEPFEPVDSPRVIVLETRKRLVFLCDTLHDAKRHASPHGTFRKSR